MPLNYFTIKRPADMHCHFRQGKVLEAVVPTTAETYGYAIAMPNTTPPITTRSQALAYRGEINRAALPYPLFTPLCVAYVNESLDPDELRAGFLTHDWYAAKLYPQGGTTGSEHAASSLRAVYPVFEAMQEIGMPLLIHGEVVGPLGREHPRWKRELVFSETVLPQLERDFPTLKMVCEHVSTERLVNRVWRNESGRLAATFTPHHALLADGDVSRGGVWADPNCMPMIKGPRDRNAIQRAMISGDPRFFAGTDSAPHDAATKKYMRCCSFGAFVAPGSLEVYATIFERRGVFKEADGVARFERFMSVNGPAFYGIPPTYGTITMVRNTHGQKITKRFLIPGTKILEPDTEIVPLFHEDLPFAPEFPWVVGSLAAFGE